MNRAVVFSAFLVLAITLAGCVSPLMKAAGKGDSQKVIELLDKGADVDEKASGGFTPLMYALFRRQPDMVEFLLAHGAKVDQQDDKGWAALSLAARNGYADMVKILLAHGAKVDLQDPGGLTALSWADEYGHADIVKILIDHGADSHAKREGYRPQARQTVVESAKPKEQDDEVPLVRSTRESKPMAAAKIFGGKQIALPPAEDVSYEAPEAASRPAARTSDVDRPTYKLDPRRLDYALIIGVEKYSKLPAASFAERDADAVRKHLEAMGFPPRNIIQLKGQAATRGALQGYIEEWLPRNVKPESTLFFYYSGHGAPDPKTGEAFLVPWDGDAMFLQSTAYPLKQLYSSLAKLKAKEIVIALDSCFSGAGGRSVLAAGARPLVTKVDEGVVPRGNMTLFAAASGDEITGSLDEQGHGMFTYYFLKGLGGAAKDSSGAVTAKSLYEYLKPNVQDEANRQNREQTPKLMGKQDWTINQF